MSPEEKNFSDKVYSLVAQVPSGRVMTYGQIAALCGSPTAARIVGGVAHFGPSNLPWHRVVNKRGGLASGYYGGRHTQKEHLEAEGVIVTGESDSYFVDIEKLIWWPNSVDGKVVNGR